MFSVAPILLQDEKGLQLHWQCSPGLGVASDAARAVGWLWLLRLLPSLVARHRSSAPAERGQLPFLYFSGLNVTMLELDLNNGEKTESGILTWAFPWFVAARHPLSGETVAANSRICPSQVPGVQLESGNPKYSAFCTSRPMYF